MHSAIYRGSLRHRRHTPRVHAFRYPLFMMYLDLAELETVFRGRWLWSTRRAAFARWDRRDYFGDQRIPLDTSVRDLVESRTGSRPTGAIRLLTNLRYCGYSFNPVSFYYCFDGSEEEVETIVAEVTNTPWGERHCYVLSEPQTRGPGNYRCFRSEKAMHVSPFMPMDLEYDWAFSPPTAELNVHIKLRRPSQPHDDGDRRIFDATLQLERAPVTSAQLAWTLISFPLTSLLVIARIHWQAFKLWLKRTPVYTHPAPSTGSGSGGLSPISHQSARAAKNS